MIYKRTKIGYNIFILGGYALFMRYDMKKQLFAALSAVLLLFSAAGCGGTATPSAGEDTLNILATTYPVYLFATAVTDEVEGVEVSLLVNQQTSCLHDYTLTVNDMKAIEKADIIIMNGAGLEDFMDDALAASDAMVIDCSEGIELLPATGHHDHDHGDEDEGEHYDPHFWMDPDRACQMVVNISNGLTAADETHKDAYSSNALGAHALLGAWESNLQDILTLDANMAPSNRNLITFHDGFQYFADAFNFTLLKAIEEEEGAEASAAEIREIVALIEEHDIPVIFTERNGSDSTAQAIARETGVAVAQLDMIMSGEGKELSCYLDAQLNNAAAIVNSFAGKEVLILGS